MMLSVKNERKEMPFSIIPFLLLIIPILEIGVFILVGGEIGFLPTAGLVLLTAILGSILLRWQGFQVLTKLQSETQAGRVPGRELVHGAMILVAGVMLLTPGFITDAIGLLLFVPGIRDVIWGVIASRLKVVTTGFGSGFQTGSPFETPDDYNEDRNRDDVVDLDPEEFSDIPNPESPWGDSDKLDHKKD